MIRQYGIIGNPLGHSFSPQYFTHFFAQQHIEATYSCFELQHIEDFVPLIQAHPFSGLNVTSPYKERILPYLNGLDKTAQTIGAVNVIAFDHQQLIGYNTDALGFQKALTPLLSATQPQALILGTGGAAKAIYYALRGLQISATFVSRTPHLVPTFEGNQQALTYADLTEEQILTHTLLINSTPLGMPPYEALCPPLPYHWLTPQHLLFDVVYNPSPTRFMQEGLRRGCRVSDGLEMLRQQAIAAWQIWNA